MITVIPKYFLVSTNVMYLSKTLETTDVLVSLVSLSFTLLIIRLKKSLIYSIFHHLRQNKHSSTSYRLVDTNELSSVNVSLRKFKKTKISHHVIRENIEQ